MSKIDKTQEFIKKSEKIHKNKYNYSKSIYINAHTKVCVSCPDHGDFFINPNNHISGKQGCKLCGISRNKQCRPKSTYDFIVDAQKIHGKERYDYSEVNYQTNHTKIKIKCNTCGCIFEQTPNSHLCQKSGCIKCNKNKKKSVYYTPLLSKVCKRCGEEKEISNFRIDKKKNNIKYVYYRNTCKLCESIGKKSYRSERMDRNKNREYHRKYSKRRRYYDPSYRLRKDISSIIRRQLSGSKHGSSIWRYLPYSSNDLKHHLENQFDSKMNWENHGDYWHIDHIIPQSVLKYDSLDHPNFLKCWGLENLRPLEKTENIRKSDSILTYL